MRILIIGGGSIGQRHLRNLLRLGIRGLGVVEMNAKKAKEIKGRYKVMAYGSLDTALKENWNMFFICTPPVFNIKIASKLIQKNVPIFIEKPISHTLKNVPDFMRKVKQKRLPVMVGYNLRFHPQLQEIKRMLKKKLLGKIWGVRTEIGQYLPDWHPWEDYREGYSAQRVLGGGIALDAIHEIDYLRWLFGEITKVSAFAQKVSNLQIDTEDYVEAILWFRNGVVGQLHQDYLQRVASRGLKIIGEKGTLVWDIRNTELKYVLTKDNKWRKKRLKRFDYNKLYLDELKEFLDCVKNKKQPESGASNGYETLKIAAAIKQSARVGKIIHI